MVADKMDESERLDGYKMFTNFKPIPQWSRERESKTLAQDKIKADAKNK